MIAMLYVQPQTLDRSHVDECRSSEQLAYATRWFLRQCYFFQLSIGPLVHIIHIYLFLLFGGKTNGLLDDILCIIGPEWWGRIPFVEAISSFT